jgi:hypothetical protein
MSAGAGATVRHLVSSSTDPGSSDQGKEAEMASTPMIRADAFGLLPSIMVLLMLILASLGIVAQAATL